MFPNPARNLLKIAVTNNNVEQLMVYDMAGRMVLNTVLHNGENQVSLAEISSGTYILTATKEARTIHRQTIRVVK